MKFSTILSAAALVVAATAKNILLTNDDGFAATNIRATYYALKNAGHTVWLVAPVSQRSGWGGKFDVPYTSTLMTDGEFGYVKAGQPAWGSEPFDDHIWYFNGTPASSVSFGLDYVLPSFFDNATIDMVVAGPNEGLNQDPFFFTLSGTIGATYYSVNRGIPAIAFSGSNNNNSFYEDSLNDDPANPSNIYGGLVVDLVDAVFAKQGDNERALPVSVGLNVNFPPVGSQSANGCVSPKYTETRITGNGAYLLTVNYNATSGLMGSNVKVTSPMQNCVNGDCSLPGENQLLSPGACLTALSIFSTDYDAPTELAAQAADLLGGIF